MTLALLALMQDADVISRSFPRGAQKSLNNFTIMSAEHPHYPCFPIAKLPTLRASCFFTFSEPSASACVNHNPAPPISSTKNSKSAASLHENMEHSMIPCDAISTSNIGSNATNFHNFSQKQLTITLLMVLPPTAKPQRSTFRVDFGSFFAPTPPPREPV